MRAARQRIRRKLFLWAGLASGVVLVGAVVAARAFEPALAVAVDHGSKCAAADAWEDPFARVLECGPKLYSQYDEELIVRHFFRDRRDGIFVDIGSAHYRTNSTTYYLEHHLGWRGVAVDAIAEYGPDYAKNRPRTQFFSFIVTDRSGEKAPFYKLGHLNLMSTTSKDWAETYGRDDVVTVELPTITMNDLLARAGIDRVDFLSMDIETGEPAALAGFDIRRFRPELVCIEADEKVRDRLLTYFAAGGYERISEYARYDHINWYFRPSRDR